MGLIDFGFLLHEQSTYPILGVDAVLTVACGEPPMALTVIDKTAGAAASFGGGANRNGLNFSAVDVMTVVPACMVRAADLAGVDLDKLRDAQITFNSKTWTVMDHEAVPTPGGEGNGEIRLILEAA